MEEPVKPYSLMTVILFWAGLVIMSSLYITIPLITTFADLFKVTPAQAVWTSSAFSFSFAVGCLFYGPLSDRFGRKPVMLAGLSALSVISLLMGFISDLSSLIFFRALQGAAAASFSPVALAYAVEMFPPARRVTTIGFISTGFLMAGIAGQVFSSYINWQYGWHMVCYIVGSLYVVTALLIAWFIPPSPTMQANAGLLTIGKQMGTVFTQKNLLCAYTMALTLLLAFVGMYTALSSYLSSPLFGFHAQQILYVRLMGIIGMLLSPYAGQLVEKYGLFSALRGGMLVAALGLLCLGSSNSTLVIIAASIVFVSGIAIAAPTLIALIGKLGGPTRGAAVSAYTFVLFAGASIGPILTLQLLTTGSYFFTFMVLALCLCGGVAASLLIRQKD